MPRLTGTVVAGGHPAGGAYVQVQNLRGDFQGEVRTDDKGEFKLYPSEGIWRLVSWSPGHRKVEREISVASEDIEVTIALS